MLNIKCLRKSRNLECEILFTQSNQLYPTTTPKGNTRTRVLLKNVKGEKNKKKIFGLQKKSSLIEFLLFLFAMLAPLTASKNRDKG